MIAVGQLKYTRPYGERYIAAILPVLLKTRQDCFSLHVALCSGGFSNDLCDLFTYRNDCLESVEVSRVTRVA